MDYELRMKIYGKVYEELVGKSGKKVERKTEKKVEEKVEEKVEKKTEKKVEKKEKKIEKKPLSEYNKFVQEESKKKEYEGIKGKDLLIKIAKRWKLKKNQKSKDV